MRQTNGQVAARSQQSVQFIEALQQVRDVEGLKDEVRCREIDLRQRVIRCLCNVSARQSCARIFLLCKVYEGRINIDPEDCVFRYAKLPKEVNYSTRAAAQV